MKRFLMEWQGWLATAIVIALFFASGWLLRSFDETAGVFDAGYLQRPIVAIAWYSLVECAAWFFFQLNSPTIDRWLDRGGFRDYFSSLPGSKRNVLFSLHLGFRILALLICLALVPV